MIDLETIRMIPVKIFSRATDMVMEYHAAGRKWVDAGRPRDNSLYNDFCKIEKEYNDFMDKYYFVFSEEQSAEWKRIHESF